MQLKATRDSHSLSFFFSLFLTLSLIFKLSHPNPAGQRHGQLINSWSASYLGRWSRSKRRWRSRWRGTPACLRRSGCRSSWASRRRQGTLWVFSLSLKLCLSSSFSQRRGAVITWPRRQLWTGLVKRKKEEERTTEKMQDS